MSSSRRSKSRRWKRVLANVVVVLLAIIALLLLVGLFLPRTFRVQRLATIRATPEVLYAQVSGLRHWPEWTVWNQERDPSVRLEYGSPEVGAGASYRWQGEKLGEGRMTLTRAEAGKGVWFDLEFDGGRSKASGSLTWESADAGALRVLWIVEGDLGKSPVGRYVGLLMDRMLGTDLEQGLERLRTRLESGGAAGRG